MIFRETALQGTYIIDIEMLEDERGFFARSWCRREFRALGLHQDWVQNNISFNKRKGTLRGIHYQTAPCEEIKLVRCSMGAIYDVLIDLRPHSGTFAKWTAVELTARNRRMLYVPEGIAHGFLTLEDDTEVFYHMSAYYSAEHARGVRWNDPAFGIQWPMDVLVISEKDRHLPDFSLPVSGEAA